MISNTATEHLWGMCDSYTPLDAFIDINRVVSYSESRHKLQFGRLVQIL